MSAISAKVRKAIKRRSGGRCEALGCPACPPVAHAGVHAHHVILDGQGGPSSEENLRWICSDAHRWIHANVSAARELGLLEPAPLPTMAPDRRPRAR